MSQFTATAQALLVAPEARGPSSERRCLQDLDSQVQFCTYKIGADKLTAQAGRHAARCVCVCVWVGVQQHAGTGNEI